MDIVEVRTRLDAEKQQTLRHLSDLRQDFESVVAASKDDNADDEHDPEGATIAFERSQVGALIRQAESKLEEIRTALARLAAGTYGDCEVCGSSIAEGRLEARPTARRCITCASAGRGKR